MLALGNDITYTTKNTIQDQHWSVGKGGGMVGVRGRERVKFKSMRDQSLEFSHIFVIFNPITRIDLHDCPKELFLDCRSV